METNNFNPSQNRTPMESLILLLVVLGLSDRQLVYEEKTKINSIIKNRFPDHSEKRYNDLLLSAIHFVKNLNFNSQIDLLNTVANEVKIYYSDKGSLPEIYAELNELLEADGIVYSFEAQLFELINKIWN
jgi:hypothetical protein